LAMIRSNDWLKVCGWIGSPFSFATTRSASW
jgi:hypothetical protein